MRKENEAPVRGQLARMGNYFLRLWTCCGQFGNTARISAWLYPLALSPAQQLCTVAGIYARFFQGFMRSFSHSILSTFMLVTYWFSTLYTGLIMTITSSIYRSYIAA